MPMIPQHPIPTKEPHFEWGRPVRCTVEVTYTGAKAEEIRPWKLQTAIALLKADLTYIKLSLPKDCDIEVLSRGLVRFFWLSWEDSPLHQSLTRRTDRTSDHWRLTAEKLEDLSIERIRIFENINPPESPIESTESLLRRASMSIITPQRKTNTESPSDVDQASKLSTSFPQVNPVWKIGWGLPIRLTLEMTYTGTRASEFEPGRLSMVPVSVMSDLLRLHLPLPRKQDITLPEPSVVRCCYTTFERSPLHVDVMRGHSPTTTWHCRKRELEALSIGTVRILENTDPPEPFTDDALANAKVTTIKTHDVPEHTKKTVLPRPRFDSGTEEVQLKDATNSEDDSTGDLTKRSTEMSGGSNDTFDRTSTCLLALDALHQQVTSLIAEEQSLRDQLGLHVATIPGPPNELLMEMRLIACKAVAAVEKSKRRACELNLERIRLECRSPFVVPKVFDAYVAIAQLTPEVVVYPTWYVCHS